MASIALLPALALVAGAAFAIRLSAPAFTLAFLVLCVAAAALAVWRSAAWVVLAATTVGCAAAGALLADHDRDRALHTSLRDLLERRVGGFALSGVQVGRMEVPLQSRMLVTDDAAVRDGFVSVQVQVQTVRLDDRWVPVGGGVALSVSGATTSRMEEWRRGRLIETPVIYRRPARYLDAGVPDFERDLALAGTTLFGSVKSGLLIDVVRHGGLFDEWGGRARAHVRRVVGAYVGAHAPLSGAIVTAILIGDRTGLPEDVRARLQAAGTYHVIAISGGNIAMLAVFSAGLLGLTGLARRPAAAITLIILVTYAVTITAGPSVWRATLMAVIYLAARLLDHRAPARQSIALAALILTSLDPLDVTDAGFLLTFGATGALLEAADRVVRAQRVPAAVRWLVATICGSLAVEVALLPIGASSFSRVTAAGLVLNLVAVPAMAMTQLAGMVLVCAASFPSMATLAGWLAHLGAATLVESARLVEILPWLTARVPPPEWWLVAAYYLALLALIVARRKPLRSGAAVVWAAAVLAIVSGRPTGCTAPAPGTLRLTMFDVGQGESLLLQLPHGRTLLIDTGGAPFGSGVFDIGARVLAPTLWARGLRRLDTLLVTHADPDHIGGAVSVLTDFRPRRIWQGIAVPRNVMLGELGHVAGRSSTPTRSLRAGEVLSADDVQVRVLHPPEPAWERQRVRNDDSVVLEIVYKDVALLLTGDIGADVERDLLPQLTAARVRVLKVAHHGSRTSSSSTLLEGWRPQMALVSAGRGNTFGHPTPAVLQRLAAIGATVYRTDLDGEITVSTDGHAVTVDTYLSVLDQHDGVDNLRRIGP